MSYDLEYIPPGRYAFIEPAFVTELGGITARCKASIRRLQELELSEEDRAGFISAVKGCYRVTE